MPTPYRHLNCGDLRSPGVMEQCNSPLGLHNDDDDDDDTKYNNMHPKLAYIHVTYTNIEK